MQPKSSDLLPEAQLSYATSISLEFGLVKQRLQKKGRPIPENDIWIAAAAISHGMVLVTRDHHFAEVENLNTTDWAVPGK